jgi:hypothetical protein
MADLVSDIVGRVHRMRMKPSETNALLPLMEAFSNALHAVNLRFGDDAPSKGRIQITILREDSEVIGFKIEDNGIGFNNENYRSFLTPDSRHKVGLGGKGVGRLSWLRVFGGAKIESVYAEGTQFLRRSFDFVLDESNQIRNELNGAANGATAPRTVITLGEFKSEYKSRCPSKSETLAQRLIAHFLPILASGACPSAELIDGDEAFDLPTYFKDKIVDTSVADVPVKLDDGSEITISVRHMKCDKDIRPRGQNYNWMFLCAHERSVTEKCIDEQIGLRSFDGESIYIGCASGVYLDENVNQERDGFIFSSSEETDIRRGVASSVREYLKDFISVSRAEMVRNTQALVRENPQFLFINNEINEFVEKLPLNSVGKQEEIFVSMSRRRYRRQREFRRLSEEISAPPSHEQEIQEKVDEYMRYVDDEKKGALAEYVSKRKAILDFLDALTAYEDPEKRRHHLEDAVHALICPMKIESSQIADIDDHNLWLLDDRLAFFNFFASDKEARSYLNTGSLERPDLAFLYDSCLAWREGEQSGDKVVLVEFKRPGLEAYPNEDPIRQALRYVNLIKSSKTFRDKSGRVISNVGERTSFDCYIVADLTEGLRKQLIGLPLQPTPDSEGMFGYTDNPKAFVEIVPFSKLLKDAKARNSAFFTRLGLNG